MNPIEHNPAPKTTAPRRSVIVGPDVSGHVGKNGRGKLSRTGDGKRQKMQLKTDADVFGDDTRLGEPAKTTVVPITTSLIPCALAKKPAMCSSEHAARGAIEKRSGRALTDKEWTEDCKRLIEFGLILKRWDRQQREGSGTAVGSKPCSAID